jgi:uncharacterized protein
MREVLQLRAAEAKRLPWKNGRGTTEELALWPAGASLARGDFDWRISKASFDQPGPFSAFPGCERILVVTRGEGLVLEHGDHAARARVRRLEPYRFSGDWPTAAELVGGAVHDFNVIFQRERVAADVLVWRLHARRALETLEPGHAFLHVLTGSLVARVGGEEEPFELAVGESLWARALAREEALEVHGSDDAEAVLVRITDTQSFNP